MDGWIASRRTARTLKTETNIILINTTLAHKGSDVFKHAQADSQTTHHAHTQLLLLLELPTNVLIIYCIYFFFISSVISNVQENFVTVNHPDETPIYIHFKPVLRREFHTDFFFLH